MVLNLTAMNLQQLTEQIVTLTTGASVDDIVELVAFTNVGVSTANFSLTLHLN